MMTNEHNDVANAYADCWMSWEDGSRLRDLSFRAVAALPRDKAIDALRQAIPGGYNEFRAELLEALPETAEITIAREGSVCIYVKGRLQPELERALRCDEFDYNPKTDETRIWWD